MPSPTANVFALSKKRIWIFAGVSAALHVVVISELPRFRIEPEPPPLPMTAQLRPAERPVLPEPKAPATPLPRTIAPRPVPVVPPSEPQVESTQPEMVSAPERPFLPTLPSEPPERVSDPQGNEPPTEPAPAAQGPSAEAPSDAAPSPAFATTQPVRDLPQYGSIQYEIYFGSDKLSIGRTVQTWVIDKQSYRFTSHSETTGLAGFFRPYQVGYVSEGRNDSAGLKPETFSVHRGRTGARQLTARFDWASGELTLGPVNAPRKAALPSGTLDLISFIYQLARADLVPGPLQLHITNGNKIDIYTLEVGTEELIELPLGTTRTVPIRQVRTLGQESVEIWLAPEQGFLPVRIRFLDRDGNVAGEQVANEITAGVR